MQRRSSVIRWTALLFAWVATGAVHLSAQRPDARPLVSALPFTNSVVGDEHAALNPLSAGIPELVLIELARNPAIKTVERERLRRVLASQRLDPQGRIDDEGASHVGRILGAQFVVRGSFTSDGRGAIRIVATTIDVESGRVEHTATVDGKQANLASLIGQLAEHLSHDMRLPELPREQRQARESAQRASYETTLLFARAIEARDAGRVQQAIELLQQLLAKAPEYEAARDELTRLHSDRGR